MADHFDSGHLIGHVKDADYFELPRFLAKLFGASPDEPSRIYVPQFRDSHEPLVSLKSGFAPLDEMLEPLDLHLTKFMVIEVLAAVILCLLFIVLAHRIGRSAPTKGRFSNLLETMVLFIRDQVARPAIGEHDADRFLPFLCTIFFFVLMCNLLGMVPWLGSPTGALATTGTLALITFITVIGAGMMKMGPVRFWTGQVPHMDLPLPLAIILKPMIFALEVLGLFIKHFVLAVRLLANMLAGHLVLAVLLAFIAAAWSSPAIWGVAPATILGATALGFLELFVAFLQAYIFAFLSALFIGMAVHPH